MQRSVREKGREVEVFTGKIEVVTRKIEVFTDDFDE